MSYSFSNYKLQLPDTGTEAGNWGTIVNTNMGSTTSTYQGIEQAIGGYSAITFSTASTSLSYSDSTGNQNFRSLYLNCTGSPGAASTLTVPAIQKMYIVKNGLTGGYAITVKIGASTGTVVPNGETMLLYANGTDVVPVHTFVDALDVNSLTVSGAATVGGTGTFNGSNTLGNAPIELLAQSWTAAGATVTVTTGSAHGFTAGQFVTLDFSATSPNVAPPDGRYQINATPLTTSFTITVASGSGSGAVNVYQTKRVTWNSDFYTDGSAGTAGQFLISQGTDQPPAWGTTASAITVTGNASVGGTLAVTGVSTFNANTAIGSAATTLSGCTYNIVSTTATITKNSHGLVNGDVVTIDFTLSTGTEPPDGQYTVANAATNTFDVTVASGSGTGTAVVYKANTATLNSQLSASGSPGTAGKSLISQGTDRPPQWTDPSSLGAGGNTKLSVDSSGNFTSVIPSGSTLLPTFFNRTWVNFSGVASAVTVTYIQNNGTPGVAGAVITVTYNSHGLSAGQAIYLNFTTGTGVDGWYTVTSVTNANTFVLTGPTSLNTSGNAEVYPCNTRTGGNISSVFATSSTLGNNFAINFTVDMPDTQYAWFGSVGYDNVNQNAWLSSPRLVAESTWKTVKYIRVTTNYANALESTASPSDVSVILMR